MPFLIIIVLCVFLLIFFWIIIWWCSYSPNQESKLTEFWERQRELNSKQLIVNFTDQFRNQGYPANKLSKEKIENWKDRELSGSQAGQIYNNGWTDPNQIKNGKIYFYTNYQQSDTNLDPAKISKLQLDKSYKILYDIFQDNNPKMNYDRQINQLEDYLLPHGRKRRDLLSIQNEQKWNLIYQNIKKAETVEEVNQQTTNIEFLDDYYSGYKKTKVNLVRVQQDQLNSFLNQEQRKVFDLVIQGKNIFFTGSAGTGKSFLLQRIIGTLVNYQRKVAVTAPTGVAATNINGSTIHSFSGIGGFGDGASPKDLIERIFKQKKQEWLNNWKDTDTLIIDEVSMLSGVIFDKLEFIARATRGNNEPFGGLQLILTGDFFQLPPVNSKRFCFEAKAWNNVLTHAINLTKIYRQRESKLINLLNEIRFGELSSESQQVLKELEKEPKFPNDGIKATHLVSTKAERDDINETELSKLDGRIYSFKAKDWEDEKYKGRLKILIKNCSATENLDLKKGCQVMLIRNLRNSLNELELVNGSQGIVIGFSIKKYPIVRFTNGTEKAIETEEWNDETLLNKKRAFRIQIPLVLSWAITIHKSQGQSIERLKIDLSRVFERGQTYVALSRACFLKYLWVIGFSKSKIICDEKVKKFYQKLLKL